MNQLPIRSRLQYRFATPKPLETRPGPGCCKTAILCNCSSLFVVVFSPVLIRLIYPQTSRSYYLFFTICSLLLVYVGGLGEVSRMNVGTLGERVPNECWCFRRGKLPETPVPVDNSLLRQSLRPPQERAFIRSDT